MSIVERARYRKLGRALHKVSPLFAAAVERTPTVLAEDGVHSESVLIFNLDPDSRQLVWIHDGAWNTVLLAEFPNGERRTLAAKSPPRADKDPSGWVLTNAAGILPALVERRQRG